MVHSQVLHFSFPCTSNEHRCDIFWNNSLPHIDLLFHRVLIAFRNGCCCQLKDKLLPSSAESRHMNRSQFWWIPVCLFLDFCPRLSHCDVCLEPIKGPRWPPITPKTTCGFDCSLSFIYIWCRFSKVCLMRCLDLRWVSFDVCLFSLGVLHTTPPRRYRKSLDWCRFVLVGDTLLEDVEINHVSDLPAQS